MGRITGNWISKRKRIAIYIRDGYRCVYCGRDIRENDMKDATLDHVYPKILGGSSEPHNLVASCQKCNNEKGERTLPEYTDDEDKKEIIDDQCRKKMKRYLRLASAIIEKETGVKV